MRVVDAADFDGANDYMTRGAVLTGAADSKTGIFSAWFRIDGGNATFRTFLAGAPTVGSAALRGVSVHLTGGNLILITGNSSAPATILTVVNETALLAGASWHHVLASWNLGTSAVHIYLDDVEDAAAPSTLTDANLDYTNADTAIGANGDGSQKFNGALADLYFAPGQFLDFSNVYNRRKFRSGSGKPVHLGATGSLPTGTAPLVYLHLDDGEAVASLATNRGAGGNFTITGTLATADSSPSG